MGTTANSFSEKLLAKFIFHKMTYVSLCTSSFVVVVVVVVVVVIVVVVVVVVEYYCILCVLLLMCSNLHTLISSTRTGHFL